MDYKIIWDSGAKNDLKKIYTYYAELNRNTANSIVSQINQQLALLAENPLMAVVETQLKRKKKVYRSLLTFKGKLKIIYTVEEERIHIVMIWNCLQNPKKLKKALR